MNHMWAQQREAVLSDCIVSPDVFTQMVNRLDEFVMPYQHVLGLPCKFDFHASWCPHGDMGVLSQFSFEVICGMIFLSMTNGAS